MSKVQSSIPGLAINKKSVGKTKTSEGEDGNIAVKACSVDKSWVLTDNRLQHGVLVLLELT